MKRHLQLAPGAVGTGGWGEASYSLTFMVGVSSELSFSERERKQKSGEPPGRACGSAAPGAQSLGAPKFEPRVKH